MKPCSNGSTTSSTDLFGADEDDTVKVIVRVRPMNEREVAACGAKPCVAVRDGRTIVLEDASKAGEYVAQYDSAMPSETTQEDMFAAVGQAVVEHCMSGFNSSIFAYGR
jgi:kinesin family protein 15